MTDGFLISLVGSEQPGERPPPLLTERLTLRSFRPSDLTELYNALMLSTDIPSMLGWDKVRTKDDAQERFDKVRRATAERTALYWAVFSNSTLVGSVFFIKLETAPRTWGRRSAMLGYWVAPTHRRAGIAGEAARAVMAYGFHELGLAKIKVGHVHTNIASRTVIERLGFRNVGVERGEFIFDGNFLDHHIYEIAADEFQAVLFSDPARR